MGMLPKQSEPESCLQNTVDELYESEMWSETEAEVSALYTREVGNVMSQVWNSRMFFQAAIEVKAEESHTM